MTKRAHPPPRLALLWILAALTVLDTATARGHDLSITEARLTLDEGGFTVKLRSDLDALLLGVGPGHEPRELARIIAGLPEDERHKRLEGLTRFFQRRIRVRFDGEPAPFTVLLPPPSEGGIPYLGTHLDLVGDVPPAARHATFWASRSLPPVHLSVEWPRWGHEDHQVLVRGEESREYPLVLPEALRRTGPSWSVAGQYLSLGFTHILPLGPDHILFVLGLFLLTTRPGPLLWQVSAFTLAHTLTLGLALYGLVSLPATIVEPLIGLSIAYVAVENLLTRQLRPWRVATVFAFGLLHGLGFAGVLLELGLPRGQFALALVTFNLGVEAGQLTVLAAAFLVVGWFCERPWYRPYVVLPLSCVIAAAGLYLAAERMIGNTFRPAWKTPATVSHLPRSRRRESTTTRGFSKSVSTGGGHVRRPNGEHGEAMGIPRRGLEGKARLPLQTQPDLQHLQRRLGRVPPLRRLPG